jgi:pSer/pThr/pTyr-binding forkhead associated (FHA) protein
LFAPPGPAPVDVRLPATAAAERPLLIGRSRACDLVLRHETVSRRHAELRREDGRWLLRDLGSTNGTRDGGWRVSETEIDAGSELHLGSVLVRFRS